MLMVLLIRCMFDHVRALLKIMLLLLVVNSFKTKMASYKDWNTLPPQASHLSRTFKELLLKEHVAWIGRVGL